MFNHFPQHGHRKTRKDISRSFQIPVAHQHQVFFQKSLHLWGQLRVRGKHLSILPEEPRMAGLAAPATALHPGAIRQEGLGVGSGGWRMMDVSEPNFQLRQHQPQEACFTSLSSLRFSLSQDAAMDDGQVSVVDFKVRLAVRWSRNSTT